MKLVGTLFVTIIAVTIAEPELFQPYETLYESREPFLSFLRRYTENLAKGFIDIDRFNEGITAKFSEVMTGRSTFQVAALERINDAMAIGQVDEALKVMSISC